MITNTSCTACNRAFPSKCGWFGPGLRHTTEPRMCDQATCMACGVEQCHGNGLGRGTCKHCHYGILPGWSGSTGTCAYKGCTRAAAYRYLPGGKAYACIDHGARRLHARKAAPE